MSSESMDHFIPVSLHDLRSELDREATRSDMEIAQWNRFCEGIIALYHQRFHQRLRDTKRHYASFAPDSDTPQLAELSAAESDSARSNLVATISDLLVKANYQKIEEAQLTRILQESSPEGVEVQVDLDAYDDLLIFSRGRVTTIETFRNWRKFWRKTDVEVARISRLFLLFRLKSIDAAGEAVMPLQSGKDKPGDPDEALMPGAIHLRLFKNIPEADLEALFPNSKVRLRLFDKVKLAVTGGGGTVGGLMATISKVAAAANPVTLLIAVGGFAGILARQVKTVFAHQTRYMMKLARHLYFHSLASNTGVITRLLDMAEEEECKESLLAYLLLLNTNEQGFDLQEWDQAAEDWLLAQCGVEADFEIADAAQKLLADELIEINEAGHYRALSLNGANEKIDQIWKSLR